MEMNVENTIAVSRDQVWAALNDPEVLKASIPGCDSFVQTGENEFNARITAKVGPVKARFDFVVSMTDIDPPNGYTINGKGQGGAAGFANGSASVALRDGGVGTILSYQAEAHVGGKLAQLGSRLIDGTANKLAAEFFENLSEILLSDTEAEGEMDITELASDKESNEEKAALIPIWMWPLVLGAIIFVVYRFFI
jgi:carbon monoxide dehydrogenase subunit G